MNDMCEWMYVNTDGELPKIYDVLRDPGFYIENINI